MQEKHKVMGKVVEESSAGPGEGVQMGFAGDSFFGGKLCWGRAVGRNRASEPSCWQGKANGSPGPKKKPKPQTRQEGLAGAQSSAGEGEGQDLAVAPLGRAARAGGSGGRSKGAQGMALARLRQRDGKCKALLLK